MLLSNRAPALHATGIKVNLWGLQVDLGNAHVGNPGGLQQVNAANMKLSGPKANSVALSIAAHLFDFGPWQVPLEENMPSSTCRKEMYGSYRVKSPFLKT